MYHQDSSSASSHKNSGPAADFHHHHHDHDDDHDHDHDDHDHDHSAADMETLEGRALINATKAFATENRAYSWFVVLSTITLLGAAWATAFAPVFWPLRLLAGVVAGLLMVRLFVIYHDHQHYAILIKSVVADRLMRLVGIITLAPTSIWKHTHNVHHANNSKLHGGHVGSFPVMTTERYANSTKKERFMYLLNRHPLTIGCGYLTSFLLAMCLFPFLNNPKKHYDGLITFAFHLAVVLLVVTTLGFGALFFAIILPYGIAAAMGTYLFYSQHNFPGVMLKDAEGWTFEGAALESSSHMDMPQILNWFTGNIAYHHIHHLNSRIPFYRLPEAYKALPELQKAKRTTLAPKNVLACLRLKLWSVEDQRMISLREFKHSHAKQGA